MERLINLIKTDEVFKKIFIVIAIIPFYIALVYFKDDINSLLKQKVYIYKHYYLGENEKDIKGLKPIDTKEIPFVDLSVNNKTKDGLIFSFKGKDLFSISEKISSEKYKKLLKNKFLGAMVSCEDKSGLIVQERNKVLDYINNCKKNKDITTVFSQHIQIIDNDKGIYIFYH